MESTKVHDTPSAARFLGLSTSTLEAWRCRGGGPRYRKLGRAVRYLESDLVAFRDGCARENTSQEVA
jgi:predicted DNA-binding transcriptional regulator AlpA